MSELHDVYIVVLEYYCDLYDYDLAPNRIIDSVFADRDDAVAQAKAFDGKWDKHRQGWVTNNYDETWMLAKVVKEPVIKTPKVYSRF